MAFTWQEIVLAFVESAVIPDKVAGSVRVDPEDADDDGDSASPRKRAHVTFGLRAPKSSSGGYLRVWGPSEQPPGDNNVWIQRYNGAISISAKLAPFLKGSAPRGSQQPIEATPLGQSAGPNIGHSQYGIPPNEMGAGGTYATPTKLVESIIEAFGKAGIPW
ncbi:MAG: hypothetical protein WCI05_14505 [Myxococcales bacterium]